MAQVEFPGCFGSVHGSLSKQSPYYVRYDKRTRRHTLCNKPKKTAKSIAGLQTPKSKEARANFKLAMAYAIQVLADPHRTKPYLESWEIIKSKPKPKYSTLRGYIAHCYYEEYLKNES